MKALSLKQPWATLMALGAKRMETRSWRTHFRGDILIHASAGFTRSEQEIVYREPFRAALRPAFAHGYLPTGAIVAIVEVYDCWPTERALEFLKGLDDPASRDEIAFGNYEPGRWAWLTRNRIDVREPRPAKGSLGLWEYSAKDAATFLRRHPR